MERRKFIKSSSTLIAIPSVLALDNIFIQKTSAKSQNPKQVLLNNMENEPLKLRPHHILDIISDYGNNVKSEPHSYGHSLHIITPMIISDPGIKVQLVVGNDAVCKGCKHLTGTKCDDVLSQLNPSPSKQAYNDVLDSILLDFLEMKENTVLTVIEYVDLVDRKMPDIVDYCTHPKENKKDRLKGMEAGIVKIKNSVK
jgi:hypothetical protein